MRATLVKEICFCIICSIFFQIDAQNAQDLINLIKNFSIEWNAYNEIWRSDHDAVPAEALGYNKFGCDVSKTCGFRNGAKNVHLLSPRDIGVIAAMGDSLTAASGAGGHRLQDTNVEYRGLSFSIGGDGKLENTLTLPNILKKYNPYLYGASFRERPAEYVPFSQLNVAVPGSKAKDTPSQARELISRLWRNPCYLSMWKLITIFIGSNDVCQYCDGNENNNNPNPVESWIQNISTAIDILSKGLSKVFVNVISVPSIKKIREYDTFFICKLLHRLECPCVSLESEYSSNTGEILKSYQSGVNELTKKFERWDFTVVVHPFLTNVLVPKNNATNKSDLSYLALDCFHFSRRAHAAAASAFWNSLIQPTSEKSDVTDFSQIHLLCPNKNCPYLRTSLNTINCSNNFILSKFFDYSADYAKRVNLVESVDLTEANDHSGLGPAFWIFLGLILAIIAGIFILSCRLYTKPKKRIEEVDEGTPLLLISDVKR